MGVWGAPLRLPNYLGLLGALGLLVSAIVSLVNPVVGRRLALLSLAALGTMCVPGVVGLVPQHSINIPLSLYCVVALYFGGVALVLFYPVAWRWSLLALLMLFSVAITLVVVTGAFRYWHGEYSRPSIAYFLWADGESDALLVRGDTGDWIDPETRSLLERAGIRGTLHWTGATGKQSASHRMIILAQSRPPSFQLRYPKDRIVVYALDGSDWRMLPVQAERYSSYATLETNGSTTTLWETIGGGRQGTTAFSW